MIDAPISCVQTRDPARPGRSHGRGTRCAGSAALCASCAERLTDATGIAESLGPRPRAAGPRAEGDDLVASII